MHFGRGTWIFGGGLVVFLLFVFVFSPESMPEYKLRLLQFLNALVAAVFGWFLFGDFNLAIRSRKQTASGVPGVATAALPFDFAIKATGAAAGFIFVFVSWYLPLAPKLDLPPIASPVTLTAIKGGPRVEQLVDEQVAKDPEDFPVRLVERAVQSTLGVVTFSGNLIRFEGSKVGKETVSYQVMDKAGNVTTGELNLVVIEPFKAKEIRVETLAGEPVDIDLLKDAPHRQFGISLPVADEDRDKKPLNGSVDRVPDKPGWVRYTPKAGFTGTDTFEYTLVSQRITSADAGGGVYVDNVRVYITVNPKGAPASPH